MASLFIYIFLRLKSSEHMLMQQEMADRSNGSGMKKEVIRV
jgi:hypothetical protein